MKDLNQDVITPGVDLKQEVDRVVGHEHLLNDQNAVQEVKAENTDDIGDQELAHTPDLDPGLEIETVADMMIIVMMTMIGDPIDIAVEADLDQVLNEDIKKRFIVLGPDHLRGHVLDHALDLMVERSLLEKTSTVLDPDPALDRHLIKNPNPVNPVAVALSHIQVGAPQILHIQGPDR